MCITSAHEKIVRHGRLRNRTRVCVTVVSLFKLQEAYFIDRAWYERLDENKCALNLEQVFEEARGHFSRYSIVTIVVLLVLYIEQPPCCLLVWWSCILNNRCARTRFGQGLSLTSYIIQTREEYQTITIIIIIIIIIIITITITISTITIIITVTVTVTNHSNFPRSSGTRVSCPAWTSSCCLNTVYVYIYIYTCLPIYIYIYIHIMCFRDYCLLFVWCVFLSHQAPPASGKGPRRNRYITTRLYHITSSYSILYHIILYYIILYHIILHYIIYITLSYPQKAKIIIQRESRRTEPRGRRSRGAGVQHYKGSHGGSLSFPRCNIT